MDFLVFMFFMRIPSVSFENVRRTAVVLGALLMTLCVFVLARPTYAATCTFASRGSNDFNTAANWDCGFVPGATSTAVIPAATSTELSGTATVASLQIGSGALFGTTGFNFQSLGDVTSSGLFAAGSNTSTFGGNLIMNSGAGFSAGSGTVVFSTSTAAGGACPSSFQCVDSAVNVSFNNLVLDQSAISGIRFRTTGVLFTVNGDLQILGGFTELLNGVDMTVGGTTDISLSGSLVSQNSTDVFTANGTTTNNGAILSSSIPGADPLFVFNGNLINNGSLGDSRNDVFTFAQSFTNTGTFASGSSTVVFNGSVAQTIPGGLTFWNLTASSTGSTVSLGGDTTTTNDFLQVSGSTFSYAGHTLAVQGNFTNYWTITNNGTLLFDGIGAQSADGAYSQNLTVNKPSGTVTVVGGGASVFNGVLTLASGTLLENGYLSIWYASGNPFVVTGGVFQPGIGTVSYIGVASTTVAGLTYHTLALDAYPGLTAMYHIDTSTTATNDVQIDASSTVDVAANLVAPHLFTNSGLVTVGPSGSILHPFESLHFTDSTGTAVTAYSTGNYVYLQVQDMDRNLNGQATDTLTLPVTLSAGGDHETVTLTETGTSTGIFRSSGIKLVNSTVASPGNHQFEISGTGIGTATYTDVNDGTDTSSTTATMNFVSTGVGGGVGGGGGGGLGSSGAVAIPTVTTQYQTYLSNLKTLGIPVQALLKLPCLTDAASADPNDVCKAVYYIGADGMRHAFPNSKVFFTWYSDFSQVQLVSADQLASIPLGKNVTYKPGVRMVKFTTDPKVYAVAKGGVLRWVSSEAVATALYGASWNTNIDDISDAFYANYTFGADVSGLSDFNPSTVQASVQYPSDSLQM
jgi:hypothetical protein